MHHAGVFNTAHNIIANMKKQAEEEAKAAERAEAGDDDGEIPGKDEDNSTAHASGKSKFTASSGWAIPGNTFR